MKKQVLLFALICFSVQTFSQQFNSCFELGNGATTVYSGSHGFASNSRLFVSAPQSDSAYIDVGDTISLMTSVFDLTGMTYAILSFDHICKIDFFDVAQVEISIDGGQDWFQLTSEYITPQVNPPGSPSFPNQGFRFSAASYAAWQPGTATAVPDNSWWRTEYFDISSWSGFQDTRIRFIMWDDNIPGGNSNAGWFIDNLCVSAAPCELTPPTLTLAPPVYQNIIYNLGPYTIGAYSNDNSGINSVTLYYSVNGGSYTAVTMNNVQDSLFQGQIPAMNDGDTVCYYITTEDASPCLNQFTYPSVGCIQFIVSEGITFPYCDGFDVASQLWSDSSTVGNWQNGPPQNGIINTPHSPPNVWGVGLTAPYPPSANAILYSPVFGTVPVGSKLSFWMNYYTETGWDGTRLEYSTNGGTTWVTLGDLANTCNCQTNWYTGNIQCSSQPGWAGQSNGWVKAEYVFTSSFPFAPNIQFRFIFCSDASFVYDGFLIDDFCIEVPQPHDVGVAAIISPGSYAPAGSCQDVNVTVQNFGLNPESNFDIYYNLNDGSTTTTYGPFPFNGTLNPGQSQSILLPCVVIPSGQFGFCAYTSLSGDGNHLNDTTCSSPVGIPVIVMDSTTYCDDFESGNQGWAAVINTGGALTTAWEFGTPAFGTTSGAHSGVNAWDINLATGYMGSSNASLFSPIFDFTSVTMAGISFWLNYNTELGWDGTRLEYSTDGTTWTLMGTVGATAPYFNWYTNNVNCSSLPAWSGNSNGWVKVEMKNLSLLGLAGQPYVQFKFTFCSDPSVNYDGVSIDDFCIEIPQPYDAGISAINSPVNYAPAGSCQPVVVTLENFGLNPLTSLDIYYRMDSAGVVTTYGPFPWTGNLLPGSSIQVTLPCLTFPSGGFSLCSWTTLASDNNHYNDTTCAALVGVPVIVMDSTTFCDNFESGNIGWINVINSGGATNTSWQLGTPAFGATSGAHSGANAWDINLTAGYAGSSNASLISPIFDFTSVTLAGISFWLNYNTELGWDGTRLEYSTDGATWTLMGTVGATAPYFNWYTNNVNCSSLPAWSGNSNGWVKVEMKNLSLLGLAGQPYVQFKFTFCSDPSVNYDGVSIDDFCIEIPQPYDAGIPAVVSPSGFAPAGSCQDVSVTLENFGLNPLTSLNIYYSVDSAGVTTLYGPFPWTGNLSPGSSTTILLPCVVFPSGGFTLCSWTEMVNDNNQYNDTSCTYLVGIPTLALNYTQPYCDDFESGNIGWSSALMPAGNVGTIWELGTPAFGATTGAHSGQFAWDINLMTGYTGSSNVALYSPFFDFSNANDTKLSFWSNYNTETNYDGVRLEYTINNGTTWNLLGFVAAGGFYSNWYTNNVYCSNMPAWAGNSGGWKRSEMGNLGTIPGINGAQSIQFRFVFCSDPSVNYDGFSIDDFCLEVPVPVTAAPVTVKDNTTFPLVFAGQPIEFSSHLKNKGTTPLTSLEAQLWVDNNWITTDLINYSPALAPADSQLHVFASYSWIATAGTHDVCVITSNPNQTQDLNPTDDTLCYQIQVVDTVSALNSTICEDFETAPEFVTLNAESYTNNTSWEWGTPAQTVLNSAYSGSKAWMTKLNSNYPDRDTSGLFTTLFTINPLNYYKLSFRHMFSTELFQDGGTVDYSTDFGNTWQVLGGFDPANFWFNTPFVTALGGLPPDPGFTGSIGNYILSEFNHHFGLSATSVIFRFRFMSDYSVNNEGWVIDDFCFEDMGPTGITESGSSQSGLALGQNMPNPADGNTLIPYYLPERGSLTIEVTDLVGKRIAIIADENQMAGYHKTEIQTSGWTPGIYFYSLTFNGERLTKKMVIAH